MLISWFTNLSIAASERQIIRDLKIARVNTTFKATSMTIPTSVDKTTSRRCLSQPPNIAVPERYPPRHTST